MQTFLPYPDFKKSARSLDNKRLGKQRAECLQILNALLLIPPEHHTSRWANHPAVLMWKGFELALYYYSQAICHEWMARGYRDTCTGKIWRLCIDHGVFEQAISNPDAENYNDIETYPLPEWFGNEEFHQSHQSNLRRKLPSYYAPQFPSIPDNLPCVWPVRIRKET